VTTRPEPPLGLYVHVPFCEAKCAYCHFAIDPRRPDDARQDRYVAAVLTEMAGAEAAAADTLYFGGGTPSLLAAHRIAAIRGAARSLFALGADAEVTAEANPHDLDLGGYRRLREAGVNRLSLGVQSFDDAVLREMGRLHTALDSRRAAGLAREAGFEDVSIDLILGWPGETAARWERCLEGVDAVAPDHVSLYVLEVEGRTALSHRARQGRLDLPDDDLVADLYQRTVAALRALGLGRYEISNFARPGHESRHNAKYWDDVPFLGFGLSAHSYRRGRRWWNLETYASYCAGVERGGAAGAVAGERRLAPRERMGEAAFTGLRRRDGIDLQAFHRHHGADLLREYGSALRDSFAAGLLETKGGRLRLTDRGVLLSNEVFRIFV
jgi:putative oxygen-independent coproporphyrinogen III oxidase